MPIAIVRWRRISSASAILAPSQRRRWRSSWRPPAHHSRSRCLDPDALGSATKSVARRADGLRVPPRPRSEGSATPFPGAAAHPPACGVSTLRVSCGGRTLNRVMTASWAIVVNFDHVHQYSLHVMRSPAPLPARRLRNPAGGATFETQLYRWSSMWSTDTGTHSIPKTCSAYDSCDFGFGEEESVAPSDEKRRQPATSVRRRQIRRRRG